MRADRWHVLVFFTWILSLNISNEIKLRLLSLFTCSHCAVGLVINPSVQVTTGFLFCFPLRFTELFFYRNWNKNKDWFRFFGFCQLKSRFYSERRMSLMKGHNILDKSDCHPHLLLFVLIILCTWEQNWEERAVLQAMPVCVEHDAFLFICRWGVWVFCGWLMMPRGPALGWPVALMSPWLRCMHQQAGSPGQPSQSSLEPLHRLIKHRSTEQKIESIMEVPRLGWGGR